MKRTFLVMLAIVAALFTQAGCSDDDAYPVTPSKTYVLVHGAWQASYVWQQVKEQLELASNTSEADKQLSFIPNNIPDGIATADPMLNFRSHAYPISVKERQ